MDEMEVTIEKLGAVNSAVIDVKPLTIFVGGNNSGKTWTAYTISAIFGPYGFNEYINAYLGGYLEEKYTPIEDVYNQLLNEGTSKINLEKFFLEYYDEYINNVAKLLPVWLKYFMGTKKVSFENLKISVKITEPKENLVKRMNSLRMKENIGITDNNEGILNVSKEPGNPDMFFFAKDTKFKEKLPLSEIKRFIVRNILMSIHRVKSVNIRYYPAERTGIELIFNTAHTSDSEKTIEEVEDKTYKTNKPAETSIPIPVGQMISYLGFLKGSLKGPDLLEERNKLAEKNPMIKKYIELSGILQKDILSGNLDVSPISTAENEILFNFKDASLDIPVTSSVVKDLTQLALYLKYSARPNELYIIDEPELSLHPEAQIKLIEFIAMLVNANINVIITTHSPYFVDHIVNLIKAKKSKKKGIANKFKLKNKEAFLSQDKVSIYLFEGNSTHNILNENGRIDWSTFSSASDYLSKLYFEL